MKHHSELYRFLPSVNEVDRYLKNKGLGFGKAIRMQVKQVLEEWREEIATSAGHEDLEETGNPSFQSLVISGKEGILEHLASVVRQRGRMSARRVVNATGVVIHTNLGRAPLSRELLESLTPCSPLTPPSSTIWKPANAEPGGKESKITCDSFRVRKTRWWSTTTPLRFI